MLQQFIFTVPHVSADHLAHCLLCFPLPSVSPTIKSFFYKIWAVHYMSKIFPFADFSESFQRVLGHNLVSDWCIRPYCAWCHQSSPICSPLHPYGTAGKAVVNSSLTFVLVTTSNSFLIFVKFPIASLLKLILLMVSSLVQLSLVMRTTKHLQFDSVLISSPSEKNVYFFNSAHNCSFL